MKNLKGIIVAMYLFGSGATILAQNAISTTGGNATGSGGTVSYTLGQVVYLTITGTAGTVMQGIQQPYEITVVTGSEESGILLEWTVYPNPAGEFIMLKVNGYNFEKLYYQLFNLSGDLLLNRRADGDQTQIQMGNLKSGTYILKVSDNTRDLKTFKIIKK